MLGRDGRELNNSFKKISKKNKLAKHLCFYRRYDSQASFGWKKFGPKVFSLVSPQNLAIPRRFVHTILPPSPLLNFVMIIPLITNGIFFLIFVSTNVRFQKNSHYGFKSFALCCFWNPWIPCLHTCPKLVRPQSPRSLARTWPGQFHQPTCFFKWGREYA